MRIDPIGKLLLGLATGVVFGGLLQRGRVARSRVIIDQLLLKDAVVAKVMGTAIVVGGIGVHTLVHFGKAKLDVKPLHVGGVVGGGVAFGTGLALVGYCPGTTLAAIGEGKRDAIAAVLGMLVGAALFVRAYPTLKPLLEAGDYGKVTLHPLGVAAWRRIAATASAISRPLLAEPPTKEAFALSARLPRRVQYPAI